MAGKADATPLRAVVQRHQAATGSAHAERLLADSPTPASSFWRVIPRAAVAIHAEAEAAAELEPARGVAD